jgi:hypothetical protein
MLEFQLKAHEAGEPEASDPYLQSLAHLAGNPEEQTRLRMSWLAMPTGRGRYGVKAVGVAEHAGRVLYGAEAQRALRGPPGAAPGPRPHNPRPRPGSPKRRSRAPILKAFPPGTRRETASGSRGPGPQPRAGRGPALEGAQAGRRHCRPRN